MKVYVVTSGSYSDFGINSVWSTREKAQEYLRLCGKEHGDFNEEIDEYELDTVMGIVQVCEVVMDRGLAYKEVKQFGIIPSEYERAGFRYFVDWDYTTKEGVPVKKGCLIWWVETDDKERAIKVTAEKATQILAAGLWGNDDAVKEAKL